MDPLIAVDSSSVVFTLGISGARDTAAAYRWQRNSKKIEAINWDAGMRSDNQVLFVTLSAIDAQAKGLWLGTNVGLLYCPLFPAGGAGEWKRVLSEDQINVGVGAKAGGVWVVTTPRTTTAARTRYGKASWKLQRVIAPVAAKVQEISLPRFLDTRSPDEKRTYNRPNVSVPVAVTIEENGALWLTQGGAGHYGSPYPEAQNAWWRRDPATTAWTRYERIQSGTREAMISSLRETAPLQKSRDHTSFDLLPDAAVFPFAFYPMSEEDGIGVRKDYGNFGIINYDQNLNSARIGYWLRQRFRSWICPDDAPEEMRSFSPPSSSNSFGDDSLYFPALTDKVWAFDRITATVVRLPFSTLQKIGAKEGDNWRIYNSEAITGPDIERYPPPLNRTIHIRPSIRSMLAERRGGIEDTSKFYVLTMGNKLFSYDTRSGVFSPIPVPEANSLPRGDFPFGYASTEIFPCYSGGVFLTVPAGEKTNLLRYNPQDKSVSVLAALEDGKQFIGATLNGGLFFLHDLGPETGREIHYQPPGDAVPHPLYGANDPADESQGSIDTAFCTGFICWKQNSATEKLTGYDTERKRQTAPIQLSYSVSKSKLKLLEDNWGGLFAVSELYRSDTVHYYDRERNVWETAAPRLPKNLEEESPDLLLAAANRREIWLIVNEAYLICYDRKLKFWGRRYPLSDAVRERETYQSGVAIIATENNSDFYFGQPSGLWHFSRETGTWTERWQNFSLAAEEAQQSRVYLRPNVGEELGRSDSYYTVWGIGSQSVATGFNRITGVWDFYDGVNGYPVSGGGHLIAAREGAWLTNGYQTYYLDKKAGVCRLVFAAAPESQPPDMFRGDPRSWFLEQMKDLPKVKPRQSIEVVKITNDPQNEDTVILGRPQAHNPETRLLLLRYDKNGKEIGRSPAPYSHKGVPAAYSLLAHDGYFLIATSLGVFRTEGRDGSPWVKVPSPPGLSASKLRINLRNARFRAGIYIINDESIGYWK
jgi:hypothetical protein